MDADRRLLRLALARASALGPAERIRLDRQLAAADELGRMPQTVALRLLGRGMRPHSWQPERWLAEADRDERLRASGAFGCVALDDAGYPPQLAEIPDPPLMLFYRGKLPDWDSPLVAVVGTRRPTGRASTAAFLTGYQLAALGLAVVSGLARGVDRLAHEGTVRAGGAAVAVLANGIDRVFPSSSTPLARSVLARGGCLLSEYPPAVPAWRHQFPARNRIVSGLARAVIVVQAPLRSGALLTADHALDQGRDLYVHAAGLCGAEGAGTRELAEAGARVIGSAEEVLADWGWSSPRRAAAGPERAAGDSDASGGAHGLAGAMESELEGEAGEFNGVVFDRYGRVLRG